MATVQFETGPDYNRQIFRVTYSVTTSGNQSTVSISKVEVATNGYAQYAWLGSFILKIGSTTIFTATTQSGNAVVTPSANNLSTFTEVKNGGSSITGSATITRSTGAATNTTISIEAQGGAQYPYFLVTTSGYPTLNFTGTNSASVSLPALTYTLSISAGTGSSITVKRGSTTLTNGATITYGDSLTITFAASTGYNLGTHTVNGSTFTSGNTHTVTGAVSVVSTASLKTYTLSISAGTGSSITVKRGSTTLTNGATITHNDVLTITFAASTGYNLGTHTVNGTAFTSGNTHTVTGAVSVVSTASLKTFTLSISAGTGSSITVKKGSTTLSNGATITYGDSLTISFGASTGYNLGTHTVNGSTFTSGGTHTVTGAVSVVSTATVKSYTLSISAEGGSSITVQRTSSPKQGATLTTLGNGAVIYHSDVLKITFTASTGYAIATHTVNGSTFTSGGTHTVTGNVSVVSTATAVKSTLTASNGTFGTAQTLTVTQYSTAYTHTITYSCAGYTGTIVNKGTSTSISWTPPNSIMNGIPSATSASCTLTITTYSGSTSLGANTTTITLSVPSSVKPSPSLSVTDAMGYASTYGGYVQGYSKAKVTVTDGNQYSATTASRSTTANGVTYTAASFTTTTLTTAGANTINTTVKDSRGRTGTASASISVLAYTAPSISAFTAHRCNASGVADDNGEYFNITYTVAITSLNSHNSRTLSYRFRKTGGSWTTRTVTMSAYTQSGTTPAEAISTDSSYEVWLTLADDFNSVVRNTTLSTTPSVISFKAGGLGAAFGKAAEVDDLLDVEWNFRLRGYTDHTASVVELTSGDTAASAWKKLTDIYDALPARSSKRVWVANNFGTLRGLSGGNLLIEMVSNGASYGQMTAYQYWQGGQYAENSPMMVAVCFGGTWGDFHPVMVTGDTGNVYAPGNLTVKGSAILSGGSYVHSATGNDGESGWVRVCTISITASWANAPITLKFVRRRDALPTTVSILFENASGTNPALASVTGYGPALPYVWVRAGAAEGTWQVLIQKAEPYDSITILDYDFPVYLQNRVTMEWADAFTTTQPSGTQPTATVAKASLGLGTEEQNLRFASPNTSLTDQMGVLSFTDANSGNASYGHREMLIFQDSGLALYDSTDGSNHWNLLNYIPGDTATIGQIMPLSGFVTTSGTEIQISVPLSQQISPRVAGVTVTALTGAARGVNGYIDGSSDSYNWLTNSDYTITAIFNRSPSFVRITIKKSSAFSNVTNNTPVMLSCNPLTITFT